MEGIVMQIRRKMVTGAMLLAGAYLGACGGDPSGGVKAKDGTVRLSLSGGDFTGNSVEIIGTRVDSNGDPLPADSKYRCINSFDECFDLSGTNPTVSTDGLCPSEDVPKNGYWTFQYLVYDGPCSGGHGSGTLLNDTGNPNNFTCYDSHDVFAQLHPNETYQETIEKGINDNSIACLTENATKYFDFTSCAITSQSSSELILDCGCTYESLTCICASLSDGIDGNLQNDGAGVCTIDPDAPNPCDIVCCATGLTDCSGACVDTDTDSDNCGTCGNACTVGQTCVAGVCTP